MCVLLGGAFFLLFVAGMNEEIADTKLDNHITNGIQNSLNPFFGLLTCKHPASGCPLERERERETERERGHLVVDCPPLPE